MSAEEIRGRTQAVWDKFYSLKYIWKRSDFIKSKRNRLAFVLISKIYRQMYADTGIATDSARVAWSARWAQPACQESIGETAPERLPPARFSGTPKEKKCPSGAFLLSLRRFTYAALARAGE
jgi:hypothetical protein